MRRTETIVHRQNQNRTMSRQNRDVTVVMTAQTKQGWLNQWSAVQRLQRARFLIVRWLRFYQRIIRRSSKVGGQMLVLQMWDSVHGFGEASVYWLLDYVELKPQASTIDQCEVDAVGFVFQKSEGAAMSQKAQMHFARQKKDEVV